MPVETRQKAEVELLEHVKKALSSAETTPKQKHVRGTAFGREIVWCSLYFICLGFSDKHAHLECHQNATGVKRTGCFV